MGTHSPLSSAVSARGACLRASFFFLKRDLKSSSPRMEQLAFSAESWNFRTRFEMPRDPSSSISSREQMVTRSRTSSDMPFFTSISKVRSLPVCGPTKLTPSSSALR